LICGSRREMRKFGMIIDCTRQMLYVNPDRALRSAKNWCDFFPGEALPECRYG